MNKLGDNARDFANRVKMEALKPFTVHCFFSLLASRNLLHRLYTQNFDGLELLTEHLKLVQQGARTKGFYTFNLMLVIGNVIQLHGHIRTLTCLKDKSHTIEYTQAVAVSILNKGHQICPFCDPIPTNIKPLLLNKEEEELLNQPAAFRIKNQIDHVNSIYSQVCF